jgi:hypothetical protein
MPTPWSRYELVLRPPEGTGPMPDICSQRRGQLCGNLHANSCLPWGNREVTLLVAVQIPAALISGSMMANHGSGAV